MELNTWRPHFTAAKGRLPTARNTPRASLRLVSLAKKPSTMLSQEADVGVKWKALQG